MGQNTNQDKFAFVRSLGARMAPSYSEMQPKAPVQLSPAVQHPPQLGQPKQVVKSPVAMNAEAASKAMRPSTKTAGSCSNGVKKAPRYSSKAKVGKKPMPLPHATQIKKAYTLMNNSCEMIGFISSDRIHDGMATARAIGGGLICDTDLEKIAKLNYLHAEEQRRGKAAMDPQLQSNPEIQSLIAALMAGDLPSVAPNQPAAQLPATQPGMSGMQPIEQEELKQEASLI